MRLQAKSKCDLLTDAIIEGIIAGRYRQGQKLPSESELEAEYQVSRVTVRESLKQLRTMGLVTIQQGEGTLINEFKLRNYMQPLFPLMILQSQEIGQLYDARGYIEMGAVYEATGHLTAEQRERLEQIIEQTEKASAEENYEAFTELDSLFHYLICEFSENQVLLSVYYMIRDVLKRYIRETNRGTTIISQSCADHKEIVRLMAAGDGNQASLKMKEHILRAKENLLKAEAGA